ncbi:hypothetical protein [Ottowia sp.]|uniref:hypothetical protein n=1 Tax=Ottowia sp. TaxID=1898956 RepID=UPI002D1FBB79|nr:hypothetical protein [Ottowia sp.]
MHEVEYPARVVTPAVKRVLPVRVQEDGARIAGLTMWPIQLALYAAGVEDLPPDPVDLRLVLVLLADPSSKACAQPGLSAVPTSITSVRSVHLPPRCDQL